ncbi:hypothetical protein KF840_06335 [bacterium]|nr:hypothetical protein [bacterium]
MLRRLLFATTMLILCDARIDAAPAPCVGDCDGDGAVAIAEVVTGVSIALERRPLADCAASDADADLNVSIAELMAAVGFALTGCPPAATPTATAACGDAAVADRYRDCVRSQSQAQCVGAGGEWGPYPFSGRLGCFCPTGQRGCACRASGDCLGFCISPLSDCGAVREGLCSDRSVVAGCFCTPFGDEGFIGLCVDP